MYRLEGTDGCMDEATKWVRVDVLDFFGILDPYTFQDWITVLEDYFNWFGLSAKRKVHCVRMKMKGQVRVWRNNFIGCINPQSWIGKR